MKHVKDCVCDGDGRDPDCYPVVTMDFGTVYIYRTGERLCRATRKDLIASTESKRSTGTFMRSGQSCFVDNAPEGAYELAKGETAK